MEEKIVYIVHDLDGEWEGIYIHGTLIDENHELGNRDLTYLLKLSEKYKFKSKDVKDVHISERDNNMLAERGCYPQKFKDFKDYEHYK